jgi:hypothetical protein
MEVMIVSARQVGGQVDTLSGPFKKLALQAGELVCGFKRLDADGGSIWQRYAIRKDDNPYLDVAVNGHGGSSGITS